jgi:hypothetical protein
MSELKDLPGEKATNFLARVREEVQILRGRRGDKLDRALTLRDLLGSGLAALGPGGTQLIPGPGAGGSGGGSGGSGPTVPAYVIDLTPPPAPTSFAVDAGVSNLFVSHGAPLYTQGNGHLRTHVYGVNLLPGDPLPTFSAATPLSQFSGTVDSIAVNSGETWRLWIKWETNDGVLSASPAGGTNGLEAITAPDVPGLLAALAGQITASELSISLSTPIGQIPGIASTLAQEAIDRATAIAAETQARANAITAESLARANAITAEANARTQGLLAEASARGTAITTANTLRQQGDDQIAATVSTLTATVNTDRANTAASIQAESSTRATADQAESTQRTTLAARVTTAEGRVTTNTAAITAEQTTRATADSTNAAATSTLAATVNTDRANTAASILLANTTRATADTANATQITTLQSQARNSAVLPEDFRNGLIDFTNARGGSPDTVLNVVGTIITNDPDFGQCIEISDFNVQGENVLTRGVVLALPGRIYRVTTRFKVTTLPVDGVVLMNHIIPHLSETYGNSTATFSSGITVSTTSVQQFTDLISDTAPPGGSAWAVGTKYLRFGLRLNSSETGLALRVQSIKVEDITDAQANTAALQVESTTRATADTALADSITSLNSSLATTNSAVATKADTTALTALTTRVTNAEGVNTSQAGSITSLNSSLATTNSNVGTAQTAANAANTNANTRATSAALNTLNTQVQNGTTGLSATANRVGTLEASVNGQSGLATKASNSRVDQVVIDANGALSTAVQTLSSSIEDARANARITTSLFYGFDTGTGAWYGGGATTSASGGIVTWTPNATNSHFSINFPVSDRYVGALAPMIRARVRRVSGVGAWEGRAYYSTPTHGASNSFVKTLPAPSDFDAWNELEWDMAALTAGGTDYLDNEIRNIRIDLVSDATSVWEFDWVAIGSATTAPLSAALQVESTTRATQTGELYAQFTVKTDVAGLVSGYGLASSANNAAPTSAFGIQAGQFFVAPPAIVQATAPTVNRYKGMVWLDTSVNPAVRRFWSETAWSTTPQALPFVVQVVPQTINGVVVAPGIYAENAFFGRLVATRGQIGLLAVDDARIASLSATKLTAGSIAVGQHIQSTSYIAGQQGWRINGDGTAEFSQVTVRGTVFATNGQFLGTLLGGSASGFGSGLGMFSGWTGAAADANYRWRVGSPTGARIQWTGSAVEVYNGSNQLTLSSGGVDWSVVANKPAFGTLASQNSVTTGQVSGLGLLATRNSVGYTEVSGTKPPSNATNGAAIGVNLSGQITAGNASTFIANAAIGSAQIANASIGSAQIANASIGNAQIANAAITTAKIGDLAVNTLQIAGNAVTIPVGNFTEGAAYVNPGVWTTMQLSALNSSGSPIIIIATAFAIPVFGQVGGAQTISYPEIRVSCNDVEIFKINGTISFVHQPGAGFKSYKIEARGASGTGASHRSLVLLEAKK